MQIQIALPDDIAHSLEAKWGSIEQRLLEMLVIAAYQEGSISARKVRELLSMSTHLEVDAFLKQKGVYLHYNETDFEQDIATMRRLEQEGQLKR